MRTLLRLMAVATGVTLAGTLAFATGGTESEEQTGEGAAAMMELPPSEVWQWDTLADYEQDTGNQITQFSEAPMLAARVAAGELPPVEERLPEEPLVLNVLEGIGQYGGTLITPAVGTAYTEITPLRGLVGTIQTANRGPGAPHLVVPFIHKGFEFSADQTVLTMYLRKGMKWSDGEPYTADDVMFWLEDWHLTPDFPDSWVKLNWGPIARGERVDDYTVRIHYAEPFPTLIGWYEWWGGWYPRMYPKHYMSKWHPKYNPDAEKLAKEEGFESWVQAFNSHSTSNSDFRVRDADAPALQSWIYADIGTLHTTYVRNPYHWAIDPAGNQLPYLDRLRVETVADQEGYNLMAISGDMTIVGLTTTANNLPLYKENAEKGDYEVLLWPHAAGGEAVYAFNMNSEDPVLREIFQDLRFRQAMSLAINRDEINEVVFFGMATPRQAAMNPENAFYKDEWATRFAEYDPERAKQLLDEMGLEYDQDGKFRLRPDGKTFELRFNAPAEWQSVVDINELVVEYWQDVGVKVDWRATDWDLYESPVQANKHDVVVNMLRMTNVRKGYNPVNAFLWGGRLRQMLWTDWHLSGGERGEEPPQKYKELYETASRWFAETDEAERDRLAVQVFDFISENVMVIGTVGFIPRPIIVSNKLRNFPRDVRFYGDDVQYFRDVKPETWFLRE